MAFSDLFEGAVDINTAECLNLTVLTMKLPYRAPIALLTQSAGKRLEPTDVAQVFHGDNNCRAD